VSGAEDESTGAEATGGESGSSSGGLQIDCSMCSETVEPDPLCHSSFNAANGQCECDDGYIFASAEPDDFSCVRDEDRGKGDCGSDPNVTMNANGDCVCLPGYEWCTSNPDDLSCCEV